MNADMRKNDFQHISQSSHSLAKVYHYFAYCHINCVVQYGINGPFFWCAAIFARGQAICHTQMYTECSLRLPWLLLAMCHPSYDHALCFCPRGIPPQPNLNALFEALGTFSRRQPSYDHPRRCLLAGIHKMFLSAPVLSPGLENVFL